MCTVNVGNRMETATVTNEVMVKSLGPVAELALHEIRVAKKLGKDLNRIEKNISKIGFLNWTYMQMSVNASQSSNFLSPLFTILFLDLYILILCP